MTTVIDHTMAIQALRECVRDRGESFVYTSLPSAINGVCKNWHLDPNGEGEGEPGCIVGMALHKLGVSRDFLASSGVIGAGVLGVSKMLELPDAGIDNFRLTSEAMAVFAEAQLLQDERATWGQALRAAEHMHQHIQDNNGQLPEIAWMREGNDAVVDVEEVEHD